MNKKRVWRGSNTRQLGKLSNPLSEGKVGLWNKREKEKVINTPTPLTRQGVVKLEIMKDEIIEWDDIDITVKFIYGDDGAKSLEFWAYECVGEYADGGGKMYELLGASSSDETTTDIENTDIEKAQTLIQGRIKWDGCSHLTFGDDDGYIHACGYRSWRNLHEVIGRIWNYATDVGFDYEEFENKVTTPPNK